MTATALQEIEVATPRRKWPGYPGYKPSEMNWVHRLPEHWRVLRLKNIASVRFSSVDKKSEDGETPVRLCNYTDVYNNDWIVDDPDFMQATATADEIARFTLKKGDVLITKDSEAWNDIAVPAYVTADMPGVLCGYHLAHIRPSPASLDGAYLSRAFEADGIRQQFHVAANGITRFGLPNRAISGALFPVPPLDEQRAIAAFLDRETARIDELIAKKQRLIELLKEKRQAVISRAVTKGLDPNAPMKPSGIDWLGEIPAHWGIQPLKYQSAKIGSGKTPRGGAEVYVSTGVVLLRSQNIHDEGMRLEDLVFIDDETDQEMANSRVKPGDVLLNITGASIGRCSIAPDNLPKANVNQHVCIIRPRKIKTEFLHAILCSKEIKDWIQSHENGTSREGLNFRQVGNVRIPIPPEAEQNEIVSRLQKRTSQLDKLMKSVDEAIDKLRDYRSALITAAVTGQIDVRQLGKEAP